MRKDVRKTANSISIPMIMALTFASRFVFAAENMVDVKKITAFTLKGNFKHLIYEKL